MLFHSSLRKELARSFGATLVVLVTIVMTMMLIRTLGQAAGGSVNPSEVMLVMGFTVLGYLPTILTLSLFASIVATLSRMYVESEMVIWFAAGRGLSAFLSPLLRFAWPILLGIGVLSLWAWPWSNQQIQELRVRYERRSDIDRVTPGQFQEASGGRRVFFIDKDTPDSKTGNNIFISTQEPGKESVISARRGRIEDIKGDRFLMLSNGQRLESPTDKSGLRISEFEQYGTQIGKDAQALQDQPPVRTLSTLDLLHAPTPLNQAEFAWRIGLLLAATNLVVIALAVSSVNPRAGRSGNLVFALFAFIIYYNFVNVGQSWVAAGKVSLPRLLVVLHGAALALGVGWLLMRHNNLSLRQLWRQRRMAKGGA